MGGSYKDNSEEELLRDVIDGDEVEGADDSLTAKLSSRIKEDVLQHDINTVLFTLPARERNVSSPFMLLCSSLRDYCSISAVLFSYTVARRDLSSCIRSVCECLTRRGALLLH